MSALSGQRVTAMCDPSNCPLCGGDNRCQRSSDEAYKGPCWCYDVAIPAELVDRVPASHRNQACICRECVNDFARETAPCRPAARLAPGDFYFENGLLVFTARYHLKRGFCCKSQCRHCPYSEAESAHP